MAHSPADDRYERMQYRRCGQSGLKLPALSLGLWHNFGGVDPFDTARALVLRAFDLGITHLDLANNYGPPPGSAEITLGRILREDLGGHRDELLIATKAGYPMWPGPYGDLGSRKHLLASLDQSLKRLGLAYVDIFYSHRPDPETPLEETLSALEQSVRCGKALYVGLSNYGPRETAQAARLLRQMGVPCLIHQAKYNLLNRWIEPELLSELGEQGMGCIAFSPLAEGVLSARYLQGIPAGSRASKPHGHLRAADLTAATLEKVQALASLAQSLGQSLAQLALAWVLRHPGMTSVLIGASQVPQLEECAETLRHPALSAAELDRIEAILRG